MSRIQSSVGLITGIPIEDTVNKLMALAGVPRDRLTQRTSLLDNERLAVNNLTSLMLAFEFEVNRLSAPSLFQSKTVTSSDSNVITAKLADGGNPALGQYKVRALQTASAQQLASASLQSLSDLATEGTVTFGFGGYVDKGISLDQLNDGAGVRRGRIRITDRAGNSADIDLRIARTIDDVLDAINDNSVANITAVADGDAIRLIDSSGGSGNLRVQELGGAKTALDLGLASINVAADEATGGDLLRLHTATKLSTLNDGTGVPLAAGNDLSISLADESTLNIDLGSATTLGQVLDAINAANPAKLSAAIAADGNRIELTDLTAGVGEFTVASVGTGEAAEALGLTTTAAGDTITGRRLISGLRDTLASSLRGGAGVGTLGVIDVTNRNGVTSNVDLSAAETLNEIVAAINAQAVGVTATVNTARNGLLLSDTTGATASNFIVVDGDSNESATALGIVVDEEITTANSGSLDRRQVGRATLLSTLNHGDGVDVADILITDSNGVTGAVDLNAPGNLATTLGDVIDRINALSNINVEAHINDTGDGILLIDLAGGSGTLKVEEVGSHTAAADLNLLGTGVTKEIDGSPQLVIDGTSRFSIDLSGLGNEGEDILLSTFNGGQGVSAGAFEITDRDGNTAAVVIPTVGNTILTVGDVIDAINAKGLGVEARINDEGTGILLFDTSGGTGTLSVVDLAGGSTAGNLGIGGTGVATVVDETTTQAIDGAGKFSQSATQSGLESLAAQINSKQAGVTASTVYDGIGYRLVITVDETGAGRDLLIDGLGGGLEFEQVAKARDAIVELGGGEAGTGLLISSATNTFTSVIPGAELTIAAVSTTAVNINVAKSQSGIVSAVQDFVDAFNSVRGNLDTTTAFDQESLTTGILFGTTAALRVETDLNRVLSGRFFGLGKFASLESIGLSFDDKGKLKLNATKLQSAFEDEPAALEKFFTDSTFGVGAKLKATIEQLAGQGDSVLATRAKTLADVIESNSQRITSMSDRLTRERERLLTEFARLESTVAAMQQGLTALAGLQIIPPLTSTQR